KAQHDAAAQGNRSAFEAAARAPARDGHALAVGVGEDAADLFGRLWPNDDVGQVRLVRRLLAAVQAARRFAGGEAIRRHKRFEAVELYRAEHGAAASVR